MLTVRTVADLRAALGPFRRAGRRIGLVPTMGALHEGHLSLLRRARGECDLVVMSLFVNPRQFDQAADLRAYPRDEARDSELAAEAGVDVLFAPAREEVYPPGFVTTVSVGGPAEGLESEHRGRGHFDGVATVVAKLLGMVGPQVAYFGEKDAQQLAVVRRLVADLDIPCAIAACPTIRDPDGLALSSRNARLSATERARATVLYAALESVRATVADGERDPVAATATGRALVAAAGAELEYLALVDPATFAPLDELDRDALAVIAARVGPVRLIDNLRVPVRSGGEPPDAPTPAFRSGSHPPTASPHPDHAAATPAPAQARTA
ncbi:MAG TPA: pantoate--beta-alanine ligase [Solirubrobacteraceae bacterium]|nr:pantoate--beta-alanine ligase [Solirubrobacteraceae bacterium]